VAAVMQTHPLLQKAMIYSYYHVDA